MRGPFDSFKTALMNARRVSKERGVNVKVKHQDSGTTQWFIDWVEATTDAPEDEYFDEGCAPYDDLDFYKYREIDDWLPLDADEGGPRNQLIGDAIHQDWKNGSVEHPSASSAASSSRSTTSCAKLPKQCATTVHFFLLRADLWSRGGLTFLKNLDLARRFTVHELALQMNFFQSEGFPCERLELFIVGNDDGPPISLGRANELVPLLLKAEHEQPYQSQDENIFELDLSEVWLRSNLAHGTHWAVLERLNNSQAMVHFINTKYQIVDELVIDSTEDCRAQLCHNNFKPWDPSNLIHRLHPLPDLAFQKVDHYHERVFSRMLCWNKW